MSMDDVILDFLFHDHEHSISNQPVINRWKSTADLGDHCEVAA
jgi:hypothetical protein